VNVLGLVDTGSLWYPEWYERIHTLEEVKKLAEAGVNIIETHFSYGFGIESDRDDMELTRKVVENAHKLGLKVTGYLQVQSLCGETFFVEFPEAREWLQRDYEGRVRTYGGVYWRQTPCISHQGWIDYLLRLIELGIKEIKLDGIRLDNDYFRGCYCEKCRKNFRKYLEDNHTPEERKELLGFAETEAIEPPPENAPHRDPLYQFWVRWRCEHLERFHEILRDRTKELSPEATFGGNPAYPRDSNWAAACGINAGRLGETMDMIIAENSRFPRMESEGIESQSEAYKMAEAGGYLSLPCGWNKGHRFPQTAEEIQLALYETAAYGGQVAAAIWSIRAVDEGKRTFFELEPLLTEWNKINRFLEKHEFVNEEAYSIASIGVYYPFASLAFDYRCATSSLLGIEQVLLRGGLPWSIIFDAQLHRLSAFDLVLLPNLRWLSDEEIDTLKDFAKEGGVLWISGETGYYDQYGRTRGSQDPWTGVANSIRHKDTPEASAFWTNMTSSTRADKYLSPITPGGWKEIRQELIDLLPNPAPAIVDGEETIACDVYRFKADSIERIAVHILNYENTNPRQNVVIRLSRDLVAESAFVEYLLPNWKRR